MGMGYGSRAPPPPNPNPAPWKLKHLGALSDLSAFVTRYPCALTTPCR